MCEYRAIWLLVVVSHLTVQRPRLRSRAVPRRMVVTEWTRPGNEAHQRYMYAQKIHFLQWSGRRNAWHTAYMQFRQNWNCNYSVVYEWLTVDVTDNDDESRDKTNVGHDTCTLAAFQKAGMKTPFKDDWWFWCHFVPHLLGCMHTSNYSNIERFYKVIATIKWCIFLPHSVLMCNKICVAAVKRRWFRWTILVFVCIFYFRHSCHTAYID